MNDDEYGEVWGDPERTTHAVLLGAEPEPPMLAAPGGARILDKLDKGGQWRPDYGLCDVYRVTKAYPLGAQKWLTLGNVELRGDEFVFSADGPADGYIATTVTVPAGVHFRFSFEAGYRGNRTNAYGTQAAFRVEAAVDNVTVAAAEHEEPAGGPREHRRPRGFAFVVPGSGDVEVELRFHDRTDRDGAARDLRIKPQVAVAIGTVSKEVAVWKDASGKYDTRYYSEPDPPYYEYAVRGKIADCGQGRTSCPAYRNGRMCDRWWDVAAKVWRDERIQVWADIPCEGLFTYTYETGGTLEERGSGEPYELRGHMVDCGSPTPPDPSDCPVDEFYSCRDITGGGSVTFTRHRHVPCEGDVIERATYKGRVYTPAGLVECTEVESIEEARKRDGEDDCPTARWYSCEDHQAEAIVTFTKRVLTDCDGKQDVARTYGGEPYEVVGEEKGCGEVESEEEARKREGKQDCEPTVEWCSCTEKTGVKTVTYTRKAVTDCRGKTSYTRTYKGKPYTVSDIDAARCGDPISEEEARKREGEKGEDCKPTVEWFSCTDEAGAKSVTYTRKTVTDCDGKVTHTRTYKGKPYKPSDLDGAGCGSAISEEEARKREGEKARPTIRRYECSEYRTGSRGKAYFRRWENSLGRARDECGPDFGTACVTYFGGWYYKRNGIDWYYFGKSSRDPILHITWQDEVVIEFDAGGINVTDVMELPDNVELIDLHDSHIWDAKRRRLSAKNPSRAAREVSQMARSRFRSTGSIKSLMLRQAGKPFYGVGIANLTVLKRESALTRYTKIVTTKPGEDPVVTYEKDGKPYTPTGDPVNCEPA